MNRSRFWYWTVLALCLSLAGAGIVSGQEAQQAQKPYEPQVGQAGKDVVWVPTSDALVATMLDLAKVTPQDVVLDLGSGDGRTVIAAAKLGARAYGIEFNPDMVELSKANAAKAGVSERTTFAKADLFESDFSHATVITMFLLPSINMKLRPKLLDLKPGTRIVANTFTMEDWEADQTVTLSEPDCTSWCTALLWIVPAKVQGTWRTAQGEITLFQQFQKVTGTWASGGVKTGISEGRLTGDQLTFAVGNTRYTGRVSGDTIQGSVASGGSTNGQWSATRIAP